MLNHCIYNLGRKKKTFGVIIVWIKLLIEKCGDGQAKEIEKDGNRIN